jgi:GNAT superfamily N-acetyltransferase
MARVQVIPVDGLGDRKSFIDFPYVHYRNDPNFVPPLRLDAARLLSPRKNAFFEHGRIQPFLARADDGRVLGRVAAIVNGEHLKKHGDGVGFFGFFESVDDREVSTALFDAAGEWLRQQGLQSMRGPANPSLNDVAGLLVDGFLTPPSILMAYNPPYYERLVLEYGFERVMTMWAYFVHRKYADLDRFKRGADLVFRRYPSLHIRNLDMARFDEEVRTVRSIYNDAWSDNWGFVPMTEAEFAQLARNLKQIVDPRMAFLAEIDGEVIGFGVAIPNMNQVFQRIRNGRLLPTGLFKLLMADFLGGIQEVRLPLLGVRRAYHGRGIDAALILQFIEKVPPIGFPSCEMSWILESNPAMKNALEALGGVRDKEYALYEKDLGG